MIAIKIIPVKLCSQDSALIPSTFRALLPTCVMEVSLVQCVVPIGPISLAFPFPTCPNPNQTTLFSAFLMIPLALFASIDAHSSAMLATTTMILSTLLILPPFLVYISLLSLSQSFPITCCFIHAVSSLSTFSKTHTLHYICVEMVWKQVIAT